MVYLPWKILNYKKKKKKTETFSQIIKDLLKTKSLDGQQEDF